MNLDRKCVPECEECGHNKDGLCEKFLCPEAKFRTGKNISCGMATHLIKMADEATKVRVGQQKQKKSKGI